jgi:hypothetical protein
MKANSRPTTSKESVSTSGATAAATMASGSTTKCTARAFSPGPMEGSTPGST